MNKLNNNKQRKQGCHWTNTQPASFAQDTDILSLNRSSISQNEQRGRQHCNQGAAGEDNFSHHPSRCKMKLDVVFLSSRPM